MFGVGSAEKAIRCLNQNMNGLAMDSLHSPSNRLHPFESANDVFALLAELIIHFL